MSETGANIYAILGAFCGVLGFWFLGLYLHLNLFRSGKSDRSRERNVLLGIPREKAVATVTTALYSNPNLRAQITGHVEFILTALLDTSSKLINSPCLFSCRMDDLGSETRMVTRLNFTPINDRVSQLSHIWLFGIWPVWAACVAGSLTLYNLMINPQNPLGVLHFSHTLYPFVGQLLSCFLVRSNKQRLFSAVTHLFDVLVHAYPVEKRWRLTSEIPQSG